MKQTLRTALTLACVLILCSASRSAAAQKSAPPAATGAARGECVVLHSEILKQQVPYCVLLPPSYDMQKARRYPVLYFLHGLGGNEQMFFNSGGWELVQNLWRDGSIGEFIIVAPRGGSSFFINSQNGQYRYEDFFVKEFLPVVEKRYRIRAGRQSRGIAGISMGGYGALHMAFRHPALFSVVSAHSPALIEKLPTIAASNSQVSGAFQMFGDVFGSPLDPVFWKTNSPINIARTADLAGLKIYFDCGTQDDYGFQNGAQSLHNALESRHIAHEFHLYPGDHSWQYFASHLPASLAFDSHAFGLAAPAPGAK
jgi:S-formylglutathione hydrolase FrmB